MYLHSAIIWPCCCSCCLLDPLLLHSRLSLRAETKAHTHQQNRCVDHWRYLFWETRDCARLIALTDAQCQQHMRKYQLFRRGGGGAQTVPQPNVISINAFIHESVQSPNQAAGRAVGFTDSFMHSVGQPPSQPAYSNGIKADPDGRAHGPPAAAGCQLTPRCFYPALAPRRYWFGHNRIPFAVWVTKKEVGRRLWSSGAVHKGRFFLRFPYWFLLVGAFIMLFSRELCDSLKMCVLLREGNENTET